MMKLTRVNLIFCILVSLFFLPPQSVQAATTITFESGTDGEAIGSTISGLTFGAGWSYGDWRSARYNGKYPDGDFTSSGNIFAWLGQNQLEGRIDFVEGNASYFQVKVSSGTTVTLKGYDGFNNLLATADVAPNVNSGNLATLRINAPTNTTLHHVTLVGTANTWIIDDLETDAGKLPSPRLPVILIPGVGGSQLINDPNQDNFYDQVWLNIWTLMLSDGDEHLYPAHLQPDGNTPDNPAGAQYYTMRAGDILRTELSQDIYTTTINFFLSKGYIEGQTFIVCPYDWRKDLRQIAYNYNPAYPLNITLDECINYALARNPDVRKVNIVAHSMGGLVARTYLIDPARAAKIKNLVTLGTPYFGATKIAQLVLAPEGCFLTIPYFGCNPNPNMTYALLQDFASGFQLAPGEGFFAVYPDGYIKRWGAYLNYNQTMDLFRTHNTYLTNEAIAFRPLINGGYTNGLENGVNVTMIVGDNLPTTVRLEEVSYGQNSYYQIAGNGDGTVPLNSATMQNAALNPPVNFQGAANLIYRHGIEHGALARDGVALETTYAIFNSSGATLEEIIAGSDILSTRATGLSGRVIQVDGPVAVRFYDAKRNLTVPDANLVLLVQDIPGLFYQVNDTNSVVIKLPESGEYRIELQGTRSGSVSLRVLNFDQDTVTRSIQYLDLPTTSSSLGVLDVNDSFITAPPALQQGEGKAAPLEFQPAIIDPAAK